MENLTCSVCHNDNRKGSLFCTQCGTKLSLKQSNNPRLIMLSGDRPKAIFNLNDDRSMIGRDKNNTIALSDTQISKKHAIIMSGKGEYWIEDTKSKNGIYINGKKIEQREKLVHGCLVKLGSTILRFEIMSTI